MRIVYKQRKLHTYDDDVDPRFFVCPTIWVTSVATAKTLIPKRAAAIVASRRIHAVQATSIVSWISAADHICHITNPTTHNEKNCNHVLPSLLMTISSPNYAELNQQRIDTYLHILCKYKLDFREVFSSSS